ncbi:hypothetical protein M9Y10_005762 [Tritrichomonas musculus]|uniref:Uncharacterized protein n=1 Tax=Tritrichomonas musculus TaxID=1915356 RepID=A0ABR2JCI6_9EUKA
MIFLSYICRVEKVKLFSKTWQDKYFLIKGTILRPILEIHADTCHKIIELINEYVPTSNKDPEIPLVYIYNSIDNSKSLFELHSHLLEANRHEKTINEIRFILIPIRFQTKTLVGSISSQKFNKFHNIQLYGYIYLLLFTTDLRFIWRSKAFPGSTDITHLYDTVLQDEMFLKKISEYTPKESITSIYCDELTIYPNSFYFTDFQLVDYNKVINSQINNIEALLNIIEQLHILIGIMETDIIHYQRGINEMFDVAHFCDSMILIGLMKWKQGYDNDYKKFTYQHIII